MYVRTRLKTRSRYVTRGICSEITTQALGRPISTYTMYIMTSLLSDDATAELLVYCLMVILRGHADMQGENGINYGA